MTKKMKSGIGMTASVALVASSALAGVVVAAGPASAAVETGPNPDLAQKCGLTMALVLDASGSINSAGAVEKVRGAASSLLTALSGTGSTASVVQFGTVAKQEAGYTPITATSLSSSGALGQALTKYYNPQPPLGTRQGHSFSGNSSNFTNTSRYSNDNSAGWTNWEDALRVTKGATGLPPGGKPDLVVFITDGDPTAVNTQPGYPFYNAANPTANVLTSIDGDVQDKSLDPAITAANAIKAAGSKMLTIGVGNGLTSTASQTRLKQVSGPQLVNLDTPGATVNLSTDDVVVTTSFDKLATSAANIATALCQSSLTITKKAQSATSNQYVAAPDWSFTVTPTVTGGSLSSWISPPSVAGGSAASATTLTDANGQAAFQWKLDASTATTSLRVAEAAQGTHAFGQAVCQIRALGGGVTTTTYTTQPFTIPNVQSTDIVTCEVRNDFNYAPAMTLVKTALPLAVRTDASPPTPVTYTYVATNTGNTPLTGVVLTDDRCSPVSAPTGDANGDGRLDIDETWTFTCTRTYQGLTSPSVTNTGTIRGTDPAGTTVTATDTAVVQTNAPSIDVTKTASDTNVNVGDSVTYTYVVTNTGNVALTGVTVADPKCSPITGAVPSPLAPGASATFSCTTALTVSTINTATATGTPPDGAVVTDTATASVTVTPVGISLVKTVNGLTDPEPALLHEGDTATYTYTVTLPTGADSVDGVAVTDDRCPAITGPTGDAGIIGRLQQGETWVYTCDLAIDSATPDSLPNTATVNGTSTTNSTPVGDTDTALVNVLRPAIAVVKVAETPLIHSGDTAAYRYAVTNPGNTPLNTVTISDDTCASPTRISGDTNSDGVLDTSETWVYTCSTTVDVDTTNTVTVTGTDDGTGGTDPDRTVTDSATADVDVLNPAITLTKVPDRDIVRLGQDNEVTYTLTATNTGDAALSAVTITDTNCTGLVVTGGDSGVIGVMEPGEIWTATCSARLSQDTTNTATVGGSDALGLRVSDDAQATVTVIDPSLGIVKTPSSVEVRTGDSVTYTYTVTNTGDDPLTDVSVTDTVCSPVEPTSVATLAPGASTQFTCAMPLTATTTNFANANGTASDGLPVLDSANATVTVRNPSIGIVKTASKAIVDPGSSVTYTYAVTNTGDTPLGPVTVDDDSCTNVTPASVATLAPGASTSFECTTTLDADTVNTAVASGEVPLGGPPVTNDAQATVEVVPSGIAVTKSASATMVHSGDTVTYTYSVTNPERGALSTVTVTDDFCSPVSFTGGDSNTDGLLQQGETWTYTCATPVAVDTDNTATASGTTPGGGTVEDTDTISVDVINPSIAITKSASPTVVRPGESVTYTITVTNDGDVPLTIPGGSPGDDRCQELVIVEGGLVDNVLDVGESVVLQCSLTPTESLTNTATVNATDPLGGGLGGEGKATVEVQDPRMTVTKTADQEAVNPGTTVTYTFTVTNTATPASNLTNVSVTDDKCTNITRLPDDPGDDNNLLTQNETWTYECTAVINEDIDNTVTVTARAFDGSTVTSQATESVRVLQADVAIRKTTSTPIVSLGDTATFKLEVTNLGPDPATNIVVTDTLPPGLDFVGPAADLVADGRAGTRTWTIPGPLAVGDTATVEVEFTVTDALAVHENVAEITSSDQVDPITANNRDTAAVTQEATLRLTKTADPESVTVGETSTFTITVTNDGPSRATGVVVTDTLPDGLTYVSDDPSQGTYDAATGAWSVGDLAIDASASMELVVRATVAGTLTNLATATSQQQDPERNPGAEATVVATTASPTPTPPPNLSDTGAGSAVEMARTGAALLVLGTALVAVTRRWRHSSE